VEELLTGQEISVLAFSDGYTVVPLPAAQDHKRVGEGDTGLNTGGMGVYAPAPVATPEVMKQIMSETLLPTITGMRRDGPSPSAFPEPKHSTTRQASPLSACFSPASCSHPPGRRCWSTTCALVIPRRKRSCYYLMRTRTWLRFCSCVLTALFLGILKADDG
jgi:hypothetical protein